MCECDDLSLPATIGEWVEHMKMEKWLLLCEEKKRKAAEGTAISNEFLFEEGFH